MSTCYKQLADSAEKEEAAADCLLLTLSTQPLCVCANTIQKPKIAYKPECEKNKTRVKDSTAVLAVTQSSIPSPAPACWPHAVLTAALLRADVPSHTTQHSSMESFVAATHTTQLQNFTMNFCSQTGIYSASGYCIVFAQIDRG